MRDPERAKKGLCLLKREITSLLAQHPGGMTHGEICRRIKSRSNVPGTYRNLLSQSRSILKMLIEEGSVHCRGEGASRVYFRPP